MSMCHNHRLNYIYFAAVCEVAEDREGAGLTRFLAALLRKRGKNKLIKV